MVSRSLGFHVSCANHSDRSPRLNVLDPAGWLGVLEKTPRSALA